MGKIIPDQASVDIGVKPEDRLTDKFNRQIESTVRGDVVVYALDGLTVEFPASVTAEVAIATIEAMSPLKAEDIPRPVPDVVEKWRLQAALLQRGASLLTDADAAMKQAGGVPFIAWSSAAVLRRASGSVAVLTTGLRMNDADMDKLFFEAERIGD